MSANIKYVIIVGDIALYHIIRRGALIPFEIRDSSFYDPLVNDIVNMGIIYVALPHSGEYTLTISDVGEKMIFTPWYAFEGWISKIMRVHTLFVTETILPMVIIICMYFATWQLSGVLWREEYKKDSYLLLYLG